MIESARLTSSGISLPDGGATCTSCFDTRAREIAFRDVLAVDEKQAGIFSIVHLDRSTKPSHLETTILRISLEHKPRRRHSTELLAASAESQSASSAEDAEPATNAVRDAILRRAYASAGLPSDRAPALVLVNPHSGSGHADERYAAHAAPVFAAAGLKTKVIQTTYSGEAREIAKQAALDEFGSIISVSGDGLPHEVINGLAGREDAAAALAHFGLAQLPGGSGNAMCLSLNDGERDWAAIALGIVKGAPEPADLMVLTQGSAVFYSFLSQSYGIVADTDLGTEDWRWMGGARFTVGIVLKCVANSEYPCEIAYREHDTGPASPAPPSIAPRLTVNDPVPADWTVEKHPKLSMFYVGKMQWMSYDAHVFPAADPLDGAMDMLVWDTSFGSLHALHALTKFESGQHRPLVPFYKKVSAYRLTPLVDNNYVSVDGESYPCEPFQVEVLPGAARFIVPV